MRSRRLLRITAVVFVLFAIGHTFGGMLNDTGRGLRQAALFDMMRGYTFPVEGVTRSYWQFYRGFGFLFSITLILLAVLSWMLGELSRSHPAQTRPFVAVLFLGMIPITGLAFIDFFPVPALFSLAATVLLGLAALELRATRDAM